MHIDGIEVRLLDDKQSDITEHSNQMSARSSGFEGKLSSCLVSTESKQTGLDDARPEQSPCVDKSTKQSGSEATNCKQPESESANGKQAALDDARTKQSASEDTNSKQSGSDSTNGKQADFNLTKTMQPTLVDTDTKQSVSVRVAFSEHFELYGANGVKVAIAFGHEQQEEFSLEDVQAYYIDRNALYDEHVFQYFSRWNTETSSFLGKQELTMPETVDLYDALDATASFQETYIANKGCIGVFIVRGSLDLPSPPSTKNDYEREREATDPPELDWATDTGMPKCIRYEWFRDLDTWHVGVLGKPYVFEFRHMGQHDLAVILEQPQELPPARLLERAASNAVPRRTSERIASASNRVSYVAKGPSDIEDEHVEDEDMSDVSSSNSDSSTEDGNAPYEPESQRSRFDQPLGPRDSVTSRKRKAHAFGVGLPSMWDRPGKQSRSETSKQTGSGRCGVSSYAQGGGGSDRYAGSCDRDDSEQPPQMPKVENTEEATPATFVPMADAEQAVSTRESTATALPSPAAEQAIESATVPTNASPAAAVQPVQHQAPIRSTQSSSLSAVSSERESLPSSTQANDGNRGAAPVGEDAYHPSDMDYEMEEIKIQSERKLRELEVKRKYRAPLRN